MTVHLCAHRDGFRPGWTELTTTRDQDDNTGIALAVLKLADGEIHDVSTEMETAYLLLSGSIEGTAGEAAFGLERASPWTRSPGWLHVPTATRINLSAHGAVELLVFAVENERAFPARLLEGRKYDRSLIDTSLDAPEALLVLGENGLAAGDWSGLPGHRHAQPEIDHFRAELTGSYGYVELGERVLRVEGCDTVKIPADTPHARVATPAGRLYYAFALRHLPEARYAGPKPL